MTALPRGWEWAELGELMGSGLFVDGDWVESKDQDPDGEVRLLQLADVGDGVFRDQSDRHLTTASARRLGCTYLEPGDVLVARMPDPLGRACRLPLLNGPAVTVVDVCVLRPTAAGVDPAWLMWAINSPHIRRKVYELQSGSTRKRISRRNLASIPLAVPPRAEQVRIVASIEDHLSRLDAARTALRSSEKRLTQVSNALTSARSGWPVVQVGDVAQVFVGATPKRTAAHLWGGPVAWVSSGEVAFCRIDRTRETISEDAVRPDRIHPPGTVLLAMIGEGKTRGQVAILDIPAAHNQNSAAIRPDPEVLTSEWLYQALKDQYVANRRVGSGNNQPALNKVRVAALTIPLPPLPEQRRLTTEQEQIDDFLGRLRSDLATAQARAASLRRSVIAAAFSGHLVPQDPEDEPASVLLDRVAAERAAAAPASKRTRKVKSS
jgi:type I restriction enzyme S subunit